MDNLILIERKKVIFGEVENETFELASRWASKIDPDMDLVEHAKLVSEREGTKVIDIIEDWATSQADEDIDNMEEDYNYIDDHIGF